MKRSVAFLLLPLLSGCSLMNTGSGDGQKSNWDTMGSKIQSRVKYVTIFAFTMNQVKPYKTQVCEITDQIVDLLNTYDNRDASFGSVRASVMNLVSQIADDNVRTAVTIFVDIALTESFNYAWKHYSDWIERDQVRTSITIARAVGRGLQDACNLVMSVAILNASHEVERDIFTVHRLSARKPPLLWGRRNC